MNRAVVLGGCGVVGSVAVKTLAKQDTFSEVVIADINLKRGEALAASIGPKVIAVKFDADDCESIKAVIKGASIVLNCVGPFYKTVKQILSVVIEEKVNYIDVCDDVDVTLEILDWDKKAKDAGIIALIGMGNSPGATNLIGKFGSEMLDETDSIDIFHAHGGEPSEGEGVIGHRFHCMTIDCPMYLDGELKYVKYFEPSGIALRQSFDFPVLGEVPLYPYPHPEQITMPRYIKLNQVTNKGSVVPNEYYNLTRDLCGLGLASKELLDVKGVKVAPYDFAVAYIVKERERIIKETNFGSQKGCCSIVVKGKKDGKYKEYRFHLASKSQALGEGTGIPAAMGVILMQQGKIFDKGVLPPEACVSPADFIALLPRVMEMDKKKEGGESFGGIIVQSVDENGKVTTMDI
ncbi:MAG: saccharopine dehydrogenase NADP-binding domain-containing protein [Thermodesulfobacteriota bacterium]|nr:saccharopine dehydrogenase NADP-binding domain-containing protein [Thermodesulfobacteriota bacterium]